MAYISELTYIGIDRAAADDEGETYAGYIARLLGAQVTYQVPLGDQARVDGLTPEVVAGSELLILGDPYRPWWQRLFTGGPAGRLVERLPLSLLVARRPRQPLRRMLMIMRGEESDETALAWVERLAIPGRTAVTLLPIVPPFPAFYRRGGRVQASLEVLMAAGTPTGVQLRQAIRRLGVRRVHGRVTLRHGDPGDQIRREATDSDVDLIVIAAEPYPRWQRWWLGELVGPLLRWSDRPVLVARAEK